MNTQQARALVTETFPQAFDKGRFRNFAINLLNHIDESKVSAWNSTYVKDAFKDHVKSYERLGTYTSPDKEQLDVLIVNLTVASKLERTRTAIRNFVADHLKTRDNKDAALVAFVSPTEKQWRFSYVKMEYAAIEKEDGKIGVQTKLTPARRSSYIVGEGESCHTAQSRFLGLLQDTDNHPTLEQIEDAFSVEAVTKEFFEQYKELFLDLKDDLDALAKKDKTIGAEFAKSKVSTTDFAKKLLGQIVFLYFLQKKGWLGVPKGGDWGDGPHNFLRQLLDGAFGKYDNLFNDILEPLFYDTLATDRGHDAWCKTFQCRIPFLNGGLFEPLAGYDWRKTDIVIPNSLFSNNKSTSAGDKGTGILDVFDRYNFTVNEAEPLEKEVAIDPEMLGKVFENLLEVKERKSKGSFYTPREIVHYMCQESLINYLDTAINAFTKPIGLIKRKQAAFGDEKSEQTLLGAPVRKELVPRNDIETFIHSGDQASYFEAARMEGTKSYTRTLPKTIETHARLLDDNLANIAVCDPAIGSGAFPVGMMQEIVRARSSLTPYFNDVLDRTAYHFKRHAIQNCLYGVDIDPGAVEIAKLRLWLSLVVDEDDVKQIKPLPNLDYKIVVGNSLLGVEQNLFNADLFRRLEELKPLYFDSTDRKQKENFKHEIDDLIHKLTNGKEAFDFEIYFSEVMDKKRSGGFDVVIGNPPYVRQEEITSLKPLLQSFYESYDGRADLFVYFYERAVNVVKDGGVVAYITSNKWLRGKYGLPLRRLLSQRCAPKILLDFGELPIFAAATFPMIFIGQKHRAGTCQFAQVRSLEPPYPNIPQVIDKYGQETSVEKFTEDSWCFTAQDDAAVIAKMSSVKGRIPPETIMAGIKTGFNEAFWLDEATKDSLIAKDGGCKKFIKPLLVGDDVRAWKTKPISTWIIYTPIGTNLNELGPIKNHLQPWKTRLEERALNQAWYELQQAQQRYCRLFEKPKIVYPDIAKEPRFTLDVGGRYIDMTAFALASSDLCLLAILNSKAVWFFLKRTAAVLGDADKGGRLRLKRQFLEKVPIPAVPTEKQKTVERLVERILSAKQSDAEADTSAWEREIDDLVFALYGLTKEEKALVQATTK